MMGFVVRFSFRRLCTRVYSMLSERAYFFSFRFRRRSFSFFDFGVLSSAFRVFLTLCIRPDGSG